MNRLMMAFCLGVALGLLASPAAADETQWLANSTFDSGIEHWTAIADSLEHVSDDGDRTPGGAARTLGNGAGTVVEVRSECVDLGDLPVLSQFSAQASVRAADGDVSDQSAIVYVFQYLDADCTESWGFQQGSIPITADGWYRMTVFSTPASNVRSVRVGAARRGAPEDADTRFDDISLTLRPNVQQFWAIGLGGISDRTLRLDNFNFARGGAFGSSFDSQDIRLERFGTLSLTFTGCNEVMMRFEANRFFSAPDFDDVQYPMVRVGPNLAVQECERVGFENIGADNAFMSGYWFGGMERNGEGFGIDVLEGGQSAVVSWYSYLPAAVRAAD